MGSICCFAPARSRGFSLIELMVAMLVGIILILGLSSLVVGNIRGFGELRKASYQVESSRFALQFLRNELAMSGFYGPLSFALSKSSPPADVCSSDIDDVMGRVRVAIQALDDVTASSASAFECQKSGMHIKQGSDMLLVRRASSVAIDPDDAKSGYFYLAASSSSVNIIKGGDSTAGISYIGDSRFSKVRKYIERIIYVSSCSVCSGSNADSIPTLKMIELGVGGWSAPVPLVEGVDVLQLEFGVDEDTDGYPDAWVHIPEDSDEWSQLAAVRYSLLMRNSEATLGYSDEKVYVFGLDDKGDPLTVGPVKDAFKRHVYGMTVRLHNVADRREDT